MPPTFAAALRDVRAKSRDARLAACQRLAQANEGELVEALAALSIASGDAEAVVRAAGIRAIGELSLEYGEELAREGKLTALLIERVRDHSPLVREVATIALGQLGGERAHNALEAALQSEHAEVRFQAIAGFAETDERADPRRLTALLRDGDAEVRGQAARAVATLAAAEPHAKAAVIEALKGVLTDASARTRAEAALALAQLGDASGGDVFRDALEDPTLRSDVLEAIAELSLTGYADVIARMAGNVFTSPFDRIAGARALVRLGDARGVELLRAALSGFRAMPRVLAVQAIADLARSGCGSAVSVLAPQLAKLADRPRGVDPAAVAEALELLNGRTP
jgi:HEAT repeat protein